jgi:hypothetical protein
MRSDAEVFCEEKKLQEYDPKETIRKIIKFLQSSKKA